MNKKVKETKGDISLDATLLPEGTTCQPQHAIYCSFSGNVSEDVASELINYMMRLSKQEKKPCFTVILGFHIYVDETSKFQDVYKSYMKMYEDAKDRFYGKK